MTMHILLEQLTGLSIIKYPTSTLAQIILQKEWKDLLLNKCELKLFLRA